MMSPSRNTFTTNGTVVISGSNAFNKKEIENISGYLYEWRSQSSGG